MSRPDDDKNKLFVGGLSWQTTNESLKEYFDKFGEIMDSKVMINRQTMKSRGFGFVTYKDAESVNKVLMQSVHELDGKRIDPKGCNQQAANLNRKIKESPKVFVGGVPGQVGKDELTTFFQQYGMVLDVNLMLGKDRDPNRHRGFGFVTFESQDTVDRLRALRFVEIQGRQVEIKKAEPQTPKNPGQQGQWPGQEGQWGGQQQWGNTNTAQGQNAGGWGGAEGQWGAQGQWGGWDQQQWAGYQQYGYGYDPNWQQGQGQWGAQGDASQQNYQQGANGYGYSPYGQYPQGAPAQGGGPPGGYGGYDPSQQQQQQAPPQGGPPPAGPPQAGGYGQPPQQQAGGPPPPAQGDDKSSGGYGANDGQGYNRHQAYHPYRR